ncbi:MAG: thioredoxin family protein [Erysipelotrichaceae bacterium]
MKKLILCICTLSLFILGGCSKKDPYVGNDKIIKTNAEDINRKIVRAKDSFLLFLTSEDCYSCAEYEKVLNKIEKQTPFTIYYIPINDQEEDKLRELNMTLPHYETMPMTFFVDKGEISEENTKVGFIEKDDYIKWLKTIKLIK